MFVSFTPAELILLTGAPKYLPVTGTTLFWVSNTDSDVFRLGKSGQVYHLVAGRWFSAPDFSGPWTFATPSLPDDFKRIPLEHDRSRVLASVPGTDQAAEAVLIAHIPQTARVNKKETKAPEVAFQGEAQFAPIEQTTVQRAVNTDKDVFKVGEQYYMCYQGVWFVGTTATGPWQVAESVPEAIYKIPASSPSHHVTYVTIEDDDDDEWVTYAAAAGYTGMMVAWGCTVWGTGWDYPPYYGFGGYYPYYYPHFPTYGYRRGTTRGRAVTGAARGSTGRMAARASAPATTRAPARTHAAPLPTDPTGHAGSRKPITPAPAPTRRPARVRTSTETGARPPSSGAMTGPGPIATPTDRPARRHGRSEPTRARLPCAGGREAAPSASDREATSTPATTATSTDGRADPGSRTTTATGPTRRTSPGTGRRRPSAPALNGRRGLTGSRGSQDRATTDQLDRDARARAEGAQRTRDAGSYRSGASSSRAGSYRGGGGRGGGRRR